MCAYHQKTSKYIISRLVEEKILEWEEKIPKEVKKGKGEKSRKGITKSTKNGWT